MILESSEKVNYQTSTSMKDTRGTYLEIAGMHVSDGYSLQWITQEMLHKRFITGMHTKLEAGWYIASVRGVNNIVK